MTPIEEPPPRPVNRIGFLDGQFRIPDDFDTLLAREIEELFHGEIEEPTAPQGGCNPPSQ